MSEQKSSNEDLLALEKSLKAKLNPVEPDKTFVGNLRVRLEGSTGYTKQRRLASSMLTIAGGLVVGLAIFLIGRGIMHEKNTA